MLVCPKCEFENPNNHKYCQQCGTSLAHKDCPQCGVEVTWSDKECYNCGAFIGKVWQALAIARPTNAKQEVTGSFVPKSTNAVTVAPEKSEETEAIELGSGNAETQKLVESIPQPQNSPESASDIITTDKFLGGFSSIPPEPEPTFLVPLPEEDLENLDVGETQTDDIENRPGAASFQTTEALGDLQHSKTEKIIERTDDLLTETDSLLDSPDASISSSPEATKKPLEEKSMQESTARDAQSPHTMPVAEEENVVELPPDNASSMDFPVAVGKSAKEIDDRSLGRISQKSMLSRENIEIGSREYLDLQQRYQVLETLRATKAVDDVAVLRVLDCQPLQMSPLKALRINTASTSLTDFSRSRAKSTMPKSFKSEETEIVTLVTPRIARPYLTLKSQFPENLPAIHDAWQDNGEEVVLLEDFMDCLILSELWGDDSTPQMQLVEWLQQMTELWVGLSPWHCRRSLLELGNLRVDRQAVGNSRSIRLQCLYIDWESDLEGDFGDAAQSDAASGTLDKAGSHRQKSTPVVFDGTVQVPDPIGGKDARKADIKLQDLLELWQELFHQSQRTLFGPLADFVHDLREGKMETIEELRSRLHSTKNLLMQQEQAPSKSGVTVLQLEDFEEETEISVQPTVARSLQLVSLQHVGRTHVGRLRERNEDFFGIQTQLNRIENPDSRILEARGVYILCDGMGGHAGGEVASQLAVDILKQYFQDKWVGELPSEEIIRQAVLEANAAIYDVNQEQVRSGSGRMGTTLVMALVQNTTVAVAHVGDSRLYRFTSSRGLEQVTLDHEVGQREMKRGVERELAYSRPDAYQLTQALGPRDEDYVRPEVQFLELDEDTLLILASDGLTDNNLLETHAETHLAPLLDRQVDLEAGVDRLIELANQYNGHDNITVIAIAAFINFPRIAGKSARE